ncbi:MAG TPA: BadF/BadG/BcrA/BcrD ATPase family protein [Candidatus Dormibacteraeota bacterium]|nr:BadF/BadG/BcrA/BcrD ATPase family protein [Candidatus Dormibacteraeota bacterium]
MPLVLGIDIGGSRTRGVLSDGGKVLAEAQVDGANPSALPEATVASRLQALIEKLGLPHGGQVAACCAGAAGSEVPGAGDRLTMIIRGLLPDARVKVVHDAYLVLAAADLAVGTAIIAGTGSVAFGRDARGVELRAGGWGWLLGDEGSGVWIAREAAREVLRRVDDGQEPGLLTTALMKACAVDDPLEIRRVLQKMLEPEQWASLAPVVFEVAASDSGAAGVLSRAAGALSDLALSVHARLGKPGPIVLAGGLLRHQPILERALRSRLEPHATHLMRLDAPAVSGAVRLAEQLAAG